MQKPKSVVNYVIVFILLLSVINVSQGGNKALSSSSDSIRISKLLNKAWSLRNIDPDSTIDLGFIALDRANKANLPVLTALAYKNIATGYGTLGILDSSVYYYKKALVLDHEMKNFLGQGSIYLNLGITYGNAGNDVLAEFYIKEAIKINKSLNQPRLMLSCLQSLGDILMDKNPDSARLIFLESASIASQSGDTLMLGNALTSIGNTYNIQKKYDKALEYHLKTVQLFEKTNNRYLLSIVDLNIGNVYYGKKDYKKASEYFLKSAAIKDEVNDKWGLMIAYNNLGDVYNENKLYDSAMNYYLKSLEIAREVNASDHEKKILNNFSVSLEDRVELQKAQIHEKKQQANILLLSFTLVFVVFILIIVLYRNNVRTKLATLHKNEEQLRKNLLDNIKQNEIQTLLQVMEVRDKERRRIGEDLHDKLGSLLATARLHVSNLEDKLKVFNVKNITKASGILDEACKEIRKVAHDLASENLSDFNLVQSLKELQSTIESSGKMKVELVMHDLHYISANRKSKKIQLEMNLYRIIQELVTNVIKHARANFISIQINCSEDNINLIIEDNGIGFNPNLAKKGMGMKNIQARLDDINGQINIDSTPGKGSSIIIDIDSNNQYIEQPIEEESMS